MPLLHGPNRQIKMVQRYRALEEARMKHSKGRKSKDLHGNFSKGSLQTAHLAQTNELKVQPISTNNKPGSVQTTNGHQNKKSPVNSTAGTSWGFGGDSFMAIPASSSGSLSSDQGSKSDLFSNEKTVETKEVPQPAGWAGF